MKIVITGAAGHLGSKLAQHFVDSGHEVIGFDLAAAQEPVEIFQVDLSKFDQSWVDRLRGSDVIIHLAAARNPNEIWEDVIPHNLDATLNIFEGARQAGVPRVVFASSNWVVAGYRFGKNMLDSNTVPDPFYPYGMSKLVGERIANHYADVHGMTTVCLRIGWTQWTHNNQPGTHMDMGRWGQEMWLSDDDFFGGLTAAATNPISGAVIANLNSNNPGMRWSHDELREKVGYTPKDGAPAKTNWKVRAGYILPWLKYTVVRRLFAKIL